MEYTRFGRAVVPLGGLFDDVESALNAAEAAEADRLMERVQDLGFVTEDDGILNVLINNKRYHITQSALKDLCKLLKVPAGYINKFPGSSLVLENLNGNPYRIDNSDSVHLVIWNGEERPVIAGVLPGEDAAMPASEFLGILDDGGVFSREGLDLDQIVLTGEEVALYFLRSEETTQEGFTFQLGYSLHYSPTRAVDTVALPFCKMSIVAGTGEPFEFDFEAGTRLRVAKRKKDDFVGKTLEIGQSYGGEDMGYFYEEAIKYGTIARNLDSVRFALLKFYKSKAVSTYNYSGMKLDGNQVAQETIPEYRQFASANRDQLKELATYAANNLQVSFYVPTFFNRIYTMPSNLDNPHFLLRYRKAIGTMLTKTLDEVGDIVVDV